MHTHAPTATPEAVSTSGLILSLASEIARPGSSLARRCTAIAHKLADHPANRALRLRAADLLADLLCMADQAGGAATDAELLDEEFDA